MSTLRIEKVNSLPGALTANTLYFVRSGTTVEQWISDETGGSAFKVTDTTKPQIHPFLLLGVNNG